MNINIGISGATIAIAALVVSLFALVISFNSVRLQRKQLGTAQDSNDIQLEATIAEKHEKYSNLLNEVISLHKSDFRELNAQADTTLKRIVHLFDCYDNNSDASSRLRHLVHEAAEMVYHAFKGELGWQPGANIRWRFDGFLRVEEKLTPESKIYGSDFRRLFSKQHQNNDGLYLESRLLQDEHFCELVSQVKSRVGHEDFVKLSTDIMEELDAFSAVLKELQTKFSATAKRIEEAIAANQHERFQLSEYSNNLYQKLVFKRWQLDTLNHLDVFKIDKVYINKHYNFTSYAIYNCAVIFILGAVDSWGLD